MGRAVSGRVTVEGRAVRWVRDGPLDGPPLLLLAHGAGAPYTSEFLRGVSSGLVERGLTVARFHFPYMQTMVDEGRRRPPDRPALLVATWRRMITAARRWKGVDGLVVGGKSLGGRMASMLLAAEDAPSVDGAVYLGYPLHPPGKPERLRVDHLPAVRVPQLFVSGTKDALARRPLLEDAVSALGPWARLHFVEGGDHSLAVRRSRPLAGADAWLDVVADFVRRVAARPRPPGRKGSRRSS